MEAGPGLRQGRPQILRPGGLICRPLKCLTGLGTLVPSSAGTPAKYINFWPGDILPTNKESCPVGRPAGQATLLVKGCPLGQVGKLVGGVEHK
jgi:hypothetical protein